MAVATRSETSDRHRIRRLAVGALVAFTAVVALLSAGRITAEFGNSDEGLNSSVWAMCSRSLRDDPVASALGGRRIDGVEYANHPPLLCSSTAALEAVAGESPWVTRAPAWIASLALVPLTYLLLRRIGFEAEVAAGGALVALGTPMFVVYGPMLDTPMLGAPLAAAVAAGWAGEWRDPPARWPVARLAALSLLAGLTSWQAALCALLAGAALAVWGPDRRRAVPYVAGAAAGVLLSLGWALWTYGSLGDLVDKLGYRSGGGGSLTESLRFQFDWVRILLGASLLALGAAVVSLRDPQTRPVAGLLLATSATWAVVFHGGAGGHQYWNYFVLLPAAVGGAWALDALRRKVTRSAGALRAAVAVLAVGAVLALLQVSRPTLAERLIDDGAAAGDLLASADPPADGRIAVIGDAERVYAITTYHLAAEPVAVVDVAALEAVAAADPAAPVLVVRPCPEGASGELCRALPGAASSQTELVPAADVLTLLTG